MKSLSSFIIFCGIFAMAIILSEAEDGELDKRYLAALAKNGRLPKFANAEKKDQPQDDTSQNSEKDDSSDYTKDSFLEDKRHLGAFLKVHGKPNFMRSSSYDDSNTDEKRNIASMARLGRLNSMRSSSYDSNTDEKRNIASMARLGRLNSMRSSMYGSNSDEKRNIASMARLGRLNSMRSSSYDSNTDEKRNIASMARLGRLNSMRSSSYDSNADEKRNIASMARLGRLNSMRSSSYDSNTDEKRNIASMARLGRLNAMRFARLQPYSVGGKRTSSEETSNNDESNTINVFEDPDCIESDDDETNNVGADQPIWTQSKRYVAALARSGRLPIWHSQRMWWGGKRDDSRPSWSSSRIENSHGENILNEMPFLAPKNKRCKKDYDSQMGKRNVASLARNGKLPYRSNA